MSDHRPVPAAILGGGPSLPADLERIPRNAMRIAVNHHALRLCQPEYMAYMDNPQEVPELAAALKTFNGVIVSPFSTSDVILPKGHYYDGGFTSALATWFALDTGYDPVILCGMDCYQGEQKYFYDRVAFDHPVLHYPLENHLRAWRNVAKHVPHPERIKAMSGPLVQVFGAYEPTA